MVDFQVENESNAIVETDDGCFISTGGGYMIKRDSNGNRLWETPYNDFGVNSMCNTDDGNIILGGAQNLNVALT